MSMGTVINTMRAFALLLFALLAPMCLGQSSPIFLKVKTDLTIVVHKHSTGADMVEITMRDPNYPADLLASQVGTMSSLLGTPARGLVVGKRSIQGGAGNQFSFVTATFATNGIILPDGGFRIEPFLKAFAGAPAPFTIQGLTLDFEGQRPTKKTVQHFAPKNGVVVGEGRFTNTGVLKGIEYRVALLTQNPKQITFPDRYEPQKAAPPVPLLPKKDETKWLLILSFIGIGIAGGALVYFALLRTGTKAQS